MTRLYVVLVWSLCLTILSCGPGEPESDLSSGDAAGRISETALTAHFLRVRVAADKFRSVEGSYPSAVGQLVEAGFLHAGQELDPWHTPFALSVDGGTLVVTSYGADKKPGGVQENADRVSRGTQLN